MKNFRPFTEFDSVYDLIKDIQSWLYEEFKDDNQSVNVIANYDIVTELLSEYLKTDEDTCIRSININDDDSTYMISFDTDGSIWIFKENPDVILMEDDVTFIHSDVNSKYWINNEDAMIVEFDYSSECDGDCDNCPHNNDGYNTEIARNSEGKITGFTRTKSKDGNYYSETFYSTNQDLILEQLKKINF